jgi:hypothetical protein
MEMELSHRFCGVFESPCSAFTDPILQRRCCSSSGARHDEHERDPA